MQIVSAGEAAQDCLGAGGSAKFLGGGEATEDWEKNATQYCHHFTWLDSTVRQRSEFGGAGEASANAHRRVLVRQLSVQHSEGREPSRLRTET